MRSVRAQALHRDCAIYVCEHPGTCCKEAATGLEGACGAEGGAGCASKKKDRVSAPGGRPVAGVLPCTFAKEGVLYEKSPRETSGAPNIAHIFLCGIGISLPNEHDHNRMRHDHKRYISVRKILALAPREADA